MLVPGMLFSQGATADVLVLEVCNLVAALDWSDDDIGDLGPAPLSAGKGSGQGLLKTGDGRCSATSLRTLLIP